MEKLSASLPPGFGFHPTDAELIFHYLKNKILGHKFDELIPELDIYKYEPWDLPSKCHLLMRDNKWHFFALRDRKYPNSFRSNRATEEGYWKSTGKDRNVKFQNRVIGTKKTLVFHEGRPPSGKRTDWIMHEYYIDEKECKKGPGFMDRFVLCRVTKRNGWQVDNEKVDIHYDASFPLDQSKEKVETVVKEPSSHSDALIDIDAWIEELLDPDFGSPLCEVEFQAETSQADLSSLEPKLEPVDSYPDQEEDDVDFLLENDIYGILKSVADNRSTVSNESNVETTNAASTSGNSSLNENVAEDDTGIKLRRRTRSSSAEVPFHRIKLQVSKMESRNILSVNHTVKFCNEGHHLDLNKSDGSDFSNGIAVDQESAVGQPSASSSFQSDVQSNPCSASDLPRPSASNTVLGKSSVSNVTLHESSAALLKVAKCNQGIRGAIPSAGLNLFILGACVVGSAAVIMYFRLHDARRSLASFFPLWL